VSSRTEQFEILKAVVAVAAADGTITRAERGLVTALAARIGIGRRSLEVLVERARQHQRMHEELGRYDVEAKSKAMELLVGAAAIDGHVADEERRQLAVVAAKLGIAPASFDAVWSRGLATAARLRERRGDASD
jgi:uncharacterized membrane protein YebE (DUF533 family)